VSGDPRRGTAIRDLSHKEVGPVLTLTPTAAEVVRTLVDQSSSFDSGGLRIAASEDDVEGVALELSLVGEPEALDETIEQSGATVYLDPEAAELLDDKLLDAQVAEDHVTFVLREDDPDDESPFQSFSMDEDPHLRRNGNSPH
jgi:Fe-S cluster assembly iron-binding protein IscA